MKTEISDKSKSEAFKIGILHGQMSTNLLKSALFLITIVFFSSFFQACKKDDPSPTTVPNVSANEALGRAFVEAFNIQSPTEQQAALEKIIDANYLQHNSLIPDGRPYTIGFIGSLKSSFTGFKTTVREVVATEDRVFVRSTIEGKLTGQPFLGVAATGQNVEFDLMDEWKIKNGLLYEHWDQIDWPRCFVQLGIQGLPAPFVQAASQPIDR